MTVWRTWLIGTGAGMLALMAAAVSSSLSAPAAPRLSKGEAKALLERAETAMNQGAYAEAKPLYQKLLQENDQPDLAAQAQRGLGQANIKLLLSLAKGGQDSVYTVTSGDTLSRIARKSGITLEMLKAANGLTGDIIRVGQALQVPQARFSVVVDKSQNLLTLKNKEEVVKVYRCSTGREGITPAGQFKITTRMTDPVWKGVVPPGDPKNPLGSRWLGFDLPQYGIHGTSEPDTVGQPVTRGCIRLVNADVEELYKLLPEGAEVTIVE